MAYLEPARVELPPAVRQVLRDAHVRLGGTACDAKMAIMRAGEATGRLSTLMLDRQGRLLGGGRAAESSHPAAWTLCSLLRQARTVQQGPLRMALCDVEAVRRAGLEPGSRAAVLLEAHVWQLEGLAWRQRQQRRRGREEGSLRWERRGVAGRKGRRRRELGVVFELGPWGEERRALSHEEAAGVLVPVLGT